jgi:ankyrin repeat protein
VVVEAGAKPNPVCRGGQSALEIVFLHHWSAPHRQIAHLLLDHGVRCTLREACILSHPSAAKQALAADPEAVNRPDDDGVTALVIAVLNADVELARVLLEAGATDPKGQGRALIAAHLERGKSFEGNLYKQCNFQLANFNDCKLENATFSNVNLSGIQINNANLKGAHIDFALIDGMTIYGIEIQPLVAKEMERRALRNGRKP